MPSLSSNLPPLLLASLSLPLFLLAALTTPLALFALALRAGVVYTELILGVCQSYLLGLTKTSTPSNLEAFYKKQKAEHWLGNGRRGGSLEPFRFRSPPGSPVHSRRRTRTQSEGHAPYKFTFTSDSSSPEQQNLQHGCVYRDFEGVGGWELLPSNADMDEERDDVAWMHFNKRLELPTAGGAPDTGIYAGAVDGLLPSPPDLFTGGMRTEDSASDMTSIGGAKVSLVEGRPSRRATTSPSRSLSRTGSNSGATTPHASRRGQDSSSMFASTSTSTPTATSMKRAPSLPTAQAQDPNRSAEASRFPTLSRSPITSKPSGPNEAKPPEEASPSANETAFESQLPTPPPTSSPQSPSSIIHITPRSRRETGSPRQIKTPTRKRSGADVRSPGPHSSPERPMRRESQELCGMSPVESQLRTPQRVVSAAGSIDGSRPSSSGAGAGATIVRKGVEGDGGTAGERGPSEDGALGNGADYGGSAAAGGSLNNANGDDVMTNDDNTDEANIDDTNIDDATNDDGDMNKDEQGKGTTDEGTTENSGFDVGSQAHPAGDPSAKPPPVPENTAAPVQNTEDAVADNNQPDDVPADAPSADPEVGSRTPLSDESASAPIGPVLDLETADPKAASTDQPPNDAPSNKSTGNDLAGDMTELFDTRARNNREDGAQANEDTRVSSRQAEGCSAEDQAAAQQALSLIPQPPGRSPNRPIDPLQAQVPSPDTIPKASTAEKSAAESPTQYVSGGSPIQVPKRRTATAAWGQHGEPAQDSDDTFRRRGSARARMGLRVWSWSLGLSRSRIRSGEGKG